MASGDRREDDASAEAAAVAQVWRDVTLGLFKALRDAVVGAFTPSVGRAVALLKLRQRVAVLLADARRASREVIAEQTTAVVTRADRETARDVPGAVPTPDRVISRISGDLDRQLAPLQLQAQRSVEDAFKRAVGSVMTPRPGISQAQRLENAQRVLDDLAEHGITGFLDGRGRQWELASYVEMATRTAVSRSLVNLQLKAYSGAGFDAVLVVSRTLDAPCPKCRPYENRVLSITGATVGQTLTVTPFAASQRSDRVIATVPEAIAAGLLHPGCRHALINFVDGQVMTPAGLRPKPAAVYDAEQRQRALERKVREHRQRVAVAVTPQAKAAAKRRLAIAAKASKQHAAASGIKRRPRRERIGVPR